MSKIIKLTESDLNKIIEKVMLEADEDAPFEKGKFGVRAARSKADFTPTPHESEIMSTLFSKYQDDIPPIVIRYLRKMGRKTLTKRLIDLNLLDLNTIMDEFDVTE